VVGQSVCLSVCLLVTFVTATKTAELIQIPFGELTGMGPWNHAFYGGQINIEEGTILRVKTGEDIPRKKTIFRGKTGGLL